MQRDNFLVLAIGLSFISFFIIYFFVPRIELKKNVIVYKDKPVEKILYVYNDKTETIGHKIDGKTLWYIDEFDQETGIRTKQTVYNSDGTTRDYIIEWDKNTGHKTKETNYQADGKTVSYIREYDKNTGKPIKYIEY